MSRLMFDEPAWWQRPRWRIAAAVCATAAAVAVWWIALIPPAREPIATRVANTAATTRVVPIAPAVARPAPAAASAAAQVPTPPAALSTLVAPGVHVTPLSVPAGTEPAPAGARAHDSEPEN